MCKKPHQPLPRLLFLYLSRDRGDILLPTMTVERDPVYWTWSKWRWRSRPPAVHCERLIWSGGQHHRSLSWGSSVSQRSPRLTPELAGRESSQSFPSPKSRWLRSSEHGKGGQRSHLLFCFSNSCQIWAFPTEKKTNKQDGINPLDSHYPRGSSSSVGGCQGWLKRGRGCYDNGSATLPLESERAPTPFLVASGVFSRLALWHRLSHYSSLMAERSTNFEIRPHLQPFWRRENNRCLNWMRITGISSDGDR